MKDFLYRSVMSTEKEKGKREEGHKEKEERRKKKKPWRTIKGKVVHLRKHDSDPQSELDRGPRASLRKERQGEDR